MSRIESPCIACCKLDQHKVCIGCYRHIAEIANWNRKSEAELAAIMQQVAARKQQYAHLNHQTIATSPITQAEWQAAKIKARLS
ncbi:DUF1289 domain-containing protein [Alkalimonas delamerensis]|uniref:DUF1289 domain-containing protein n=1 Tax=Alkalimonas delamerensis TaxID=265981 RepID=A0ABT9GR27_9GAMM|nr:DUF1289 domain-containing protein [Alkalimonas delamerensis]MDP4529428.1 DUF1289 domain-containing protein [Alkalimonas delamerensis]